MAYTDFLTPDEASACAEFGAAGELAASGMCKSAAGAWDLLSPSAMTKAVGAAALIAGVPAGVLAHEIGRGVTADRRDERERMEKAKLYREAAARLRAVAAERTAR